ncbi:hypothetical protein [Mycobacterium lacus]|nr:hypothetical protein [Mycobacterium lacus]
MLLRLLGRRLLDALTVKPVTDVAEIVAPALEPARSAAIAAA